MCHYENLNLYFTLQGKSIKRKERKQDVIHTYIDHAISIADGRNMWRVRQATDQKAVQWDYWARLHATATLCMLDIYM